MVRPRRMNQRKRTVDQANDDVVRRPEQRLDTHDLSHQVVIGTQFQLDLVEHGSEVGPRRWLHIITTPPFLREPEHRHVLIVPSLPLGGCGDTRGRLT